MNLNHNAYKMVRIAAALLLLGGRCLAGSGYAIHGVTDKDVAIYTPGEPMAFTFRVMDGARAVGGYTLKWERMGDDGLKESGEGFAGTNGLMVTTSLAQPGFVRMRVKAYDKNGVPLQGDNVKNGKPGDIFFDGGACVEPDRLEPVKEPADFDAFWARAQTELDAVPIKAARTELSETNAKVKIYAVEIDCLGDRPVTGYLTIPADAKPGTLPATITFHGYGVRKHVAPNWGPLNAITFNINAHGMELGQNDAYYEELAKALNRYCFQNNNGENDTPETSYYYGMALRVMRALEYIKSLPEWDGKALTAKGGSQGGLQTLWAAALDPAVTECYAGVPWSCDLGGGALGRMRGWVPEFTEALNYFDPVFHARRIKAAVRLQTRFGDYTCPPASVWLVYNNVSHDDKVITIEQGGTHTLIMRNAMSFSMTPEGIQNVGISEKSKLEVDADGR